MRHIILFLFSIVLIGGGCYIAAAEFRCLIGLVVGACVVFGKVLMVSGVLVGLGTYLIVDELRHLYGRGQVRRRPPLDIRNAGLEPSLDAGATSAHQRPGARGVVLDTRSSANPFSNSRAELQMLERQLQLAILDQTARERLVSYAMREVNGDRRLAIRKVLKDLHDDNDKYR